MTINADMIPGCRISPGGEVFEKKFMLTAGESDAKGLIPLRLIVMRAIEVATDHSNLLKIGYADLAEFNLRWVLLKLSADIIRYPEINEIYICRTWIESFNRFFSNRFIEIVDHNAVTIARIHTVWAAIDRDSRALATLSQFPAERFPLFSEKPVLNRLPAPSVRKDESFRSLSHQFLTSDIDFNRHVNAVSYITAAVNCLGLNFYESHTISRLDVSYEHECYYGEPIKIDFGSDSNIDNAFTFELFHPQGKRAAIIRLIFS